MKTTIKCPVEHQVEPTNSRIGTLAVCRIELLDLELSEVEGWA